MLRALSCLLVMVCAACAPLAPRETPPETPPETPRGMATALAPGQGVAGATVGEAEARARYAQATALVEQTATLVGGWAAAGPSIDAARAALLRRAWADARRESDEAIALAEQTVSDHYARMANQELAKTYAFAGLDEAQLLQLRAAEEIMVTGNSRLAYGRLRMLNEQLQKRIRSYTVQTGDSLWVIAARPEVYANGLLWPLIWQNNAVLIRDPNRLRKGQVLRVKSHPNADEIAEAVSVARGERKREHGVTPRIGEIRETR